MPCLFVLQFHEGPRVWNYTFFPWGSNLYQRDSEFSLPRNLQSNKIKIGHHDHMHLHFIALLAMCKL